MGGRKRRYKAELRKRVFQDSAEDRRRTLQRAAQEARMRPPTMKEIIGEMARGAFAKLEAGIRSPDIARLEITLDDKGWKIFDRVMASTELTSSSLMLFRSLDSSQYAGIFCAGLRALEMGQYRKAHALFDFISRKHLDDNEGKSDRQLGEMATFYARLLARAWAAAKAQEFFAEENLHGLAVFGYNENSGPAWPGDAVFTLEKTGELQDLALIQAIGRGCWEGAMEGYCSNASKQIAIRTWLVHSISKLGENWRDVLGIKTELSDAQLLDRFTFLMKELGIGHLLSRIPQMAALGVRGYAPYDGIITNHVLQDMTENQLSKVLFLGSYCGTGADTYGEIASFSLLRDAGFISHVVDGPGFVLADKGKQLVMTLMHAGGNPAKGLLEP